MTHPMTADTPAAPAFSASPAVVAEVLSHFLVWMDTGNRDAVSRWDAEIIYAHVATLTAKLEAERAKVSELADERDSFAGELDEANEKLDFIRDIEGALKAETARETERADAAVAEVKALREAVKQVLPWLSSAAVIEFAGPRPAEILRATLAQPAAKETI